MDAPCHGLTVLAQGEAAVPKDPVAREQSLRCVMRKLPPTDSQTPALLLTRAIAFGQVSPNLTLQEVWRRALRGNTVLLTGNTGGVREVGPRLSLWHFHSCVMLGSTARQTHSRATRLTLSLSACPGTTSARLALLSLKQELCPRRSHAPAPYR